MTQSAVSVEDGDVIDPSRMLPAFEKARVDFRQEPTAERLTDVQKVCSQILGAMLTATPATKKKVKGLNCDPKEAVEAASVLFALNTGSAAFATNCAGGDKITAHRSADALFGFSRRCLADSGLPSKETDTLRTKINYMELNRDDKAHRFVVTWNAFQDGNRLAYLALAIAISIDALVFMSGLFGANVVRSPLSDVPNYKARSAQQLEATINAALGAHQYETAALVLGSLKPITNTDGFSALADLSEVHPGVAGRVRMVLTAGADIGAVQTVPGPREQYRVRSELREYLSGVYDRHLKSDSAIVQLAKLEQLLREALRPYTHEHADMTLNNFEPVSTKEGYTSMVTISAIQDPYEVRVVRRVVNAGAAIEAIATDGNIADRYYIRPDVYRALLLIRANDPPSPQFAAAHGHLIGGAPAGSIAGGRLDAAAPPLAGGRENLRLTRRSADVPVEDDEAAERQSSEHLMEELLEHFATEIGMHTRTLRRFIQIGPRINIHQLRSTLYDIVRKDENMRRIISAADGTMGESIQQAHDTFVEMHELSEEQLRLLKQASHSIDQLRTLLLLNENGAYRNVLAKMEAELSDDEVAGHLGADQAQLLPHLKVHRRELVGADLDTKEGWDDVLSSLKSFNYRMSSLARNDRRPADRA